MKKRLIIITLVVMALGSAAVYAHGRGGGAHGFGGGMALFGHLHEIAGELDLTREQKEQIHGIFLNTREQNRQIREQLHAGFGDVAKTLIANPNDLAAAQAQLDRQLENERALKSSILQGASKALNVLTPEQRTKLALLLAEHRESRRNRRN